MQTYWVTHFFLPSAVLKEIQSLMTRFLWKASIANPYGARVAWKKMTVPYEEGGLGFKDLREWNKSVLMLQLLKVIDWNDNSLWASWTRLFMLKSTPFWIAPIPSNCSWIWRKVLGLRPIALHFLQYRIGNGQHIQLWFDPWHNRLPLLSSVHQPLISLSGLGWDAKLCSIIRDGNWCLPTSNHADCIDFRSSFPYHTPLNQASHDTILWDGSTLNTVSALQVWQGIRLQGSASPWAALVWNRLSPPRYSFFLWLAFHNAFKTKDKLSSYGIPLDPVCVLCRQASESFTHLFFDCDFSFRILVMVLRIYGWRGSGRNWEAIFNGFSALRHNSIKSLILSYGFSVVLYTIWRERNNRIFQCSSQSIRTLVSRSLLLIKDRLRSWNRYMKARSRASLLHHG